MAKRLDLSGVTETELAQWAWLVLADCKKYRGLWWYHDLRQEEMVALAEALSRYDARFGVALKTYIWNKVRHARLDFIRRGHAGSLLRRSRLEHRAGLDDLQVLPIDDLIYVVGESGLEESEDRLVVDSIMSSAGLSPGQLDVLKLRVYDGLEYIKIGKRLHTSEGAAWHRFDEARKKLRKSPVLRELAGVA